MSPYLSSHSPQSDGNQQNVSSIDVAAPFLDTDPFTLPTSTDPFTITTSNGFMPTTRPIVDLPEAFRPLTVLLEEMPIVKADGTPGLLAEYKLGPLIDQGDFPDLVDEIDTLKASDGAPDLHLVSAAFRDYSFLASAYLLEPCWETWVSTKQGYGLGRHVLPKCIAGPLVKTAKLLDIPPFMAYAASYALYNYRLADPSLGHTPYSNLRLIRAFERGLDPASSEAGFILTHVDMVQHSAGLVRGAVDLLRAASTPSHPGAIAALDLILETMTAVDASMETMWSHSKPKEYLNYRTFIFGITNQSMFPSGVVYAGQSDDQPQHFRGESGANDSMIPLLDALLQIPMPANPLTEILKDFRHYRPRPHREFLAAVREQAAILNIRAFCCPEAATDEQNIALTTRYLRLLDHVRAFRWRADRKSVV